MSGTYFEGMQDETYAPTAQDMEDWYQCLSEIQGPDEPQNITGNI